MNKVVFKWFLVLSEWFMLSSTFNQPDLLILKVSALIVILIHTLFSTYCNYQTLLEWQAFWLSHATLSYLWHKICCWSDKFWNKFLLVVKLSFGTSNEQLLTCGNKAQYKITSSTPQSPHDKLKIPCNS